MGVEALTNEEAIDAVARMQQHPSVVVEGEPANARSVWLRLATRPTPSPKLWMDAYLAAFAVTGNHQMVTFDKAFRQFQAEGLDLRLLA